MDISTWGDICKKSIKTSMSVNNLTVQWGSISVTLPPKTSLCSLTPCSVSFHSTVIITTRRDSLLKTTISPPLLLPSRSEEHTSELQSRGHLVCRLLLEKK